MRERAVMKGKARLLGFVLFVVVVLVGALFFFLPTEKRDETERRSRIAFPGDRETAVVHLYFAEKSNSFLSAEERILQRPDDPIVFGRMIVEALIRGPDSGLMRTVPTETLIRAFYLTDDGTAYVDFSTEIKDKHPGGAGTELMTIFSIVNSLVLNVDDIRTVRLLVGGRETNTLAGHIDIRKPFKADMLLIR